jgi:flagellar biosynthesis protein FliR
MDIAVSQLVVFLLAFVRSSTLIVTAPIVGHTAVPVQVKVALGLFLALVLVPVISTQTSVAGLGLGQLVLLALQEGVVGVVVGFAAGLVFQGVRAAGELMGFEFGFSLANVFDPESGQENILGSFLYMAMLMVFLMVNGHHFVIQALVISYQSVPVGGVALNAASAATLMSMTGILFVVAVKFAAPVIVASFLLNVALAILTRVAPAMNVFMLSFPLKIITGMLVLVASIPLIILVFKQLLTGFEDNILVLMKAM